MKKLILKLTKWDKEAVTTALENNFFAIYSENDYSKAISELGIIKKIMPGGDIIPEQDINFIDIKTKADEEKILKLSKDKPLIVSASDWKIIPLENIIAGGGEVYSLVSNSKEASLALTILEKGVSGIVLDSRDINEIIKTAEIVRKNVNRIELVDIKITEVRQIGMGDRVCVDTSTNMSVGQGMLVGNSSGGMFLVNSESLENPYVDARPFRVNAGGVHMYILLPNDKTDYLSGLKSGDIGLAIDASGKTEEVIIGRLKIEKRPMLYIEGLYNKKRISAILQNAETIRLVSGHDSTISVVKLKPGDKVKGYIEKAGRHFGIKIEETITEK